MDAQEFRRTVPWPGTFRQALAHSRNIIAVKLLMDVGMEPVIEMAATWGFIHLCEGIFRFLWGPLRSLLWSLRRHIRSFLIWECG
jgi:hypothetical protein